ncbi:MAG: CoA transferase [Desulfobacter sp.]|nr:MAG: CoA transferase [Desulfobacter sp.]
MEVRYHDKESRDGGRLPLEGIKVVEYGVFHAGPGGGAILGDLGAEVVKVEAPVGDGIRYWTKVGAVDMAGPHGGSLAFEVSNRNKKNICLDIKTKGGREIFNRLVREADVFLTNLRKSTTLKLNLDYDAIRRLNPKIIHASVSGYGHEGPLQDIGAFDPLGQACSGMMFNTGGATPALLHIGVLDQATAISLSHAVLAALLARERQGISQEVHVSLYGSALWLQHINLMLANTLKIDPCVPADRSHHSPLRNVFCCSDGQWVMCTHHPEEKYWARFCRVMGTPELLDDPGFTDEKGAPIVSDELTDRFDRIFATRTRDEWMGDFMAAKLMFAPIQKVMDVENDPQARANGFVRPADYPGLGEMNLPGYPARFGKCRPGTLTRAAEKGEHTEEVLQKLGYTALEIESFKEKGAAQ